MSDKHRLTGISIAGKSFYFNVNKTKNGIAYLTIVGRKTQGGPGNDEKLTLFDAQIPSFIHKMLEAYGEVCEENGIPPWYGATRPPAGRTVATLDPQGPESEGGIPLDVPQCPNCGLPPMDIGAEMPLGLIINWSPETKSHIRVRCGNCGWHPEVDEEKVTKFGAASFRAGSPEAEYWAKFVTN